MSGRRSTDACAENSKNAMRWVWSGLTLLLLAFIFGNSAADGEASSEMSLSILKMVNDFLKWLGLSAELSHHFIRKLAHFAEYSLLGGLLAETVFCWCRRSWKFAYVWKPLVCGLAAAALDETLQTFVSGRCGCAKDVLLDFTGVLWAALTVCAVLTGRYNKKEKEES